MVLDNFGSFITDASGKLHSLSKGAFDTFGMSHSGRFDPDFGSLLKGSFTDGVKSILGKAGVSPSQLETFGTSSWADTLSQVVSAVGSEATGAAAGAMIGGPVGAAFGLAMEGGQVIHKMRTSGQFDIVGYSTGQWVAIDNGQTIITQEMHNVLDKIWKRRRRIYGINEPQPDIQEAEGIEFKDSMSIGFVIGPGADESRVQVFNLLKGRDEDVRRVDVMPLAEGHAVTLDANPVWSEVRLLRFEEDSMGDYLDSDVNTDPGSEVMKDSVPFLVVEANGETLLIENFQTGAQHWVNIKELTPGRRTHTTSHNYQVGNLEGSFTGGEKAALCQGDWVWLIPERLIGAKYGKVTRQLACIQELHGRYVIGFYAVDGAGFTVSDQDPTLRPVSDSLNAYLSESKDFDNFRDAVIRGHDTARLAAGKNPAHTLLCLGITPTEETISATEKVNWRDDLHAKYHEEKEKARQSVRFAESTIHQDNVDIKGDRGLSAKLDLNEEAKKLGGDVTLGAAVLDGGQPEDDVENVLDEEAEKTKGGGAMTMLGIAGAGALLFFMS